MSKRIPKPAAKLPKFHSEAEEREFWETHDSANVVDWSAARHVAFPDLRPTTQAISLRLPLSMLAELKTLANRRDVPYQSLLKMILADRLQAERAGAPPVSVTAAAVTAIEPSAGKAAPAR